MALHLVPGTHSSSSILPVSTVGSTPKGGSWGGETPVQIDDVPLPVWPLESRCSPIVRRHSSRANEDAHKPLASANDAETLRPGLQVPGVSAGSAD